MEDDRAISVDIFENYPDLCPTFRLRSNDMQTWLPYMARTQNRKWLCAVICGDMDSAIG
uniref:GNAT family N-acetyltransferase n=2 Tax=unclassified Prevotella TaxID=2638335 RepID=A0AB33J792_9BACT